jgi:hypothetical protein
MNHASFRSFIVARYSSSESSGSFVAFAGFDRFEKILFQRFQAGLNSLILSLLASAAAHAFLR